MRRLVQFLESKWEELLVMGVAVPLLLTAILSGNPVFIIMLPASPRHNACHPARC